MIFWVDVSDYSQGFGGKFGVQTDRQDKSAVGYDSQEKVALHPSQTDMSKGFGGKFGVDKDNKDQVPLLLLMYSVVVHRTQFLSISLVTIFLFSFKI